MHVSANLIQITYKTSVGNLQEIIAVYCDDNHALKPAALCHGNLQEIIPVYCDDNHALKPATLCHGNLQEIIALYCDDNHALKPATVSLNCGVSSVLHRVVHIITAVL
jgi:hypothetical protein